MSGSKVAIQNPPPVPPRPFPTLDKWRADTAGARVPPQIQPAVIKQIDDDLLRFHQAFSPMAKRNIAASLSKLLESYIKDWPLLATGRTLPDAMNRLLASARGVATRNVASPQHKYAHAVCVGYEVATGKFDERIFLLNHTGPCKELVDYGPPKLDVVAMSTQCRAMMDAIDTAYSAYDKSTKTTAETETLKVFMAPEFYFRGSQGAYDMATIAKILPMLREKTREARFKDWLFVLGTAIAATFVEGCRYCGTKDRISRAAARGYICDACHRQMNTLVPVGAMIDNVALIQKGGEDDYNNSYVIQKEFISHIDFRRALPPPPPPTRGPQLPRVHALPDWNGPAPNARNIEIMGRTLPALPPTGSRDLLKTGRSKFQDERMGGTVFTIDQITFGLEVCLDHAKNRLASATGVQIQLLPSAGMHFQQFGCITGGLFFNVDGLGGGSSDLRINGSASPSAPARTNLGQGGQIALYPSATIPWS
jgi:hypothetical protein